MNVKNVVICDSEIRYANSLSENILACKELSVKVYICTDLDNVLKLQKQRKIHIFIVDEQYSEEERRQVFAEQTFILGHTKVCSLAKKERQIGKYQSADEIIQKIFETYAEETEADFVGSIRKTKPKLFAVYSPIHRVGKTTFALALGREIAKQKKTLYLNLEAYAGFQTTEEILNLGDLLYYMKQKNGTFGIRLQTAVQQNELLDYILPISDALDLKEITADEWKELLEQIIENSSYEQIILDIGECVQGMFQLLEICERVYMPVLMDEISQRKVQQYEQNIKRLKLDKLSHITYRFVMPNNIAEYAKLRAKEEH